MRKTRPLHVTGPKTTIKGTWPRRRREACGIHAHYPCISSANMSSHTTDIAATTTTMKDIVGLVQAGGIVSTTGTTTGTSVAPGGGQKSKTTWTSTGTVPSSDTAGVQE
jgi:hypothetical protein